MPVRRLRMDLSGLLAAQAGIVHRDQVVSVAVTDAMLRWRLERGQWRTVLPSVYAVGPDQELTAWQRELAAHLFAGESSLITGPAALRRQGLRYVPADDGRVHMLVPHTRRLSGTGYVAVHRTRLFPSARPVDGLPLASVARAAADTVRLGVSRRTGRALVAEAVQRRFASVDEFARELAEGPRRGSGLLRELVAELADGVRSAPEAELRELLADSGVLPEILWNPAITDLAGAVLPTPDGLIVEAGVALEVDSREFHLSPEDWRRTMRRHNELSAHGLLVLHFTPDQIRREPYAIVKTVVAACLDRSRNAVPPRFRLAADHRP